MNYKVIVRLAGLLLLVESAFLFLSVGVSLLASSGDARALALSALICLIPGLSAFFLTSETPKKIGRREGFLVVTLVWVIFSSFGAIPYVLSGTIPSYTDAFFESMSGFTTTGASIIDNIDGFPKGIVFWRALTHWLGGMGIIALVVSFLPLLGIGGAQLFDAEAPGPTMDKITPRIHHTARYLWGLYVAFTILETVLLMVGGMDLFDSVCHSFATMATGGFSTKQASIAFWPSPYIHYVIATFMIIAGTNFVLMLHTLRGKPGKIFRDEEYRNYLRFILFFTMVIASGLYLTEGTSLEESFRNALFNVASIITTTGFVTVDYLQWSPILILLLFTLFFVGGSTGSTGGGIKVMRIVIVMKNGYYELKRMIHPNAVIPVRYNQHSIDAAMVSNILAFFVLYLVAFFIGSILMMMMVPEMDTAFGAVASCLGNVGPGLGQVGPAYTYSHLPDLAKWLLSFLMMLGRLELFTVLVIFTPTFWKG